ncbi:MAG: sigma 54-interacting transcriptional regulator [Clostridia bacterium]|nr:sigma 54-interacting transcriptional regulator [Clostridia bacterium]
MSTELSRSLYAKIEYISCRIIEAANGSTLFLDEINSLPYVLQGKLLTALETKTIQRIGSVEYIKVDFRLITAANRDLAEIVALGEFRADLYYRLNVVNIYIPPLRERKEDIVPLANTFIEYLEKQYDRQKILSNKEYKQLHV